jgi:hypothetical protein
VIGAPAETSFAAPTTISSGISEVMKLTTRQMRTREQLLQKVTDYFGLGWKTGPRFRGRPPRRTLERELEAAA